MFFQRVKTKGLGHNAYVLGCGEGLAVVVDPRRDVAEYLKLARKNNLSVAYVIETHRQEDFEFGSRAIADLTGAKIVTGRHELFGESDVKLADGEELKVGTTRFVALETPGHTPESMSYAVYPKDAGEKCWGVFTGDALFVGDTGRTDLTDPDKTGENAGQLYDSVRQKIEPLGDQAFVLPAHGAGSACGGNISERDDTTLGIEKDTNPVFKKSRREFVEQKLGEKLPRPPYFRHMEEVNLGGGRPLAASAAPRLLQPKELQRKARSGRRLRAHRHPPARRLRRGAHPRRLQHLARRPVDLRRLGRQRRHADPARRRQARGGADGGRSAGARGHRLGRGRDGQGRRGVARAGSADRGVRHHQRAGDGPGARGGRGLPHPRRARRHGARARSTSPARCTPTSATWRTSCPPCRSPAASSCTAASATARGWRRASSSATATPA